MPTPVRYSMQYVTHEKADGSTLIFETDPISRIQVMASLLNTLLAKGYNNSLVDWYEVNRYLSLSGEPNLPCRIVTSFASFMTLYRSVSHLVTGVAQLQPKAVTADTRVATAESKSDVRDFNTYKRELLFKIGGKNVPDEHEMRNSSSMTLEAVKCS